MRKVFVICITLLLIGALAACGKAGKGDSGGSAAPPAPAPYNLTGNWDGIYTDPNAPFNMYTMAFTANGRVTLSLAIYNPLQKGCVYYGDYTWGGADGKELTLDLYHGAYTTEEKNGLTTEVYHDQGRDNAKVFTKVTFKAVFGDVRSVVLIAQNKAEAMAPDGSGDSEKVINKGAFLVMRPVGAGQGGPRYFGDPGVATDKNTVYPDSFLPTAEAAATTTDLNVRSGPSTKNPSYGMIAGGTRVDKIAVVKDDKNDSGEWAFCLFDDGGGWMSTSYLKDPTASTNQ
ncbi:MAG: SH3 domain-containing protein [Clostridiales bacterium]|nr:SH3 domain-containing protein [Clostridiales bacterium]